MNAVASIPTMEAPHHGNLVAPFLSCIGKWPGTEGELRGFEVSFWTPRDWLGPADPSNPWHLGNRVGNHSMWQAVNLGETEGPAGNSVAVSATKRSGSTELSHNTLKFECELEILNRKENSRL